MKKSLKQIAKNLKMIKWALLLLLSLVIYLHGLHNFDKKVEEKTRKEEENSITFKIIRWIILGFSKPLI